MFLTFDHEARLYQVDLTYIGKSISGASGVAFKTALEKKYKAIVNEGRYGPEAILVDKKRLDKYIKHLEKEFMEKI